MTNEFSDEKLGAYVDRELKPAERHAIEFAMTDDSALRARISDLRRIKEMVRSAYSEKSLRPKDKASVTSIRSMGWYAAATLAALALGTAIGWGAHGLKSAGGAGEQLAAYTPSRIAVVLHIDSGERERFEALLQEARELQGRQGSDSGVHVEVIANNEGTRFLGAGSSPYAAQIAQMQRENKNISFVACENSLARLRKKGVSIQLLPDVVIVPSAVTEIVKREKQGWVYVKV